MYLKTPNEVTNAARPSHIIIGTQRISGILEVNGAAMEASVSDKLIPACAA